MYRIKDTTEWYNKEDFEAENGDFVEVSTVSFDKTRWSQPQLIQWVTDNSCSDPNNNPDYTKCISEINEKYFKCVAGCRPDDFACQGACAREFEQGLNRCPCQVSSFG